MADTKLRRLTETECQKICDGIADPHWTGYSTVSRKPAKIRFHQSQLRFMPGLIFLWELQAQKEQRSIHIDRKLKRQDYRDNFPVNGLGYCIDEEMSLTDAVIAWSQCEPGMCIVFA